MQWGDMLLCSWEQGVFETQKSGNKSSLGEIGLTIRTHASPKVAQDQVSGGVSILCWHAAAVANVLWKLLAKIDTNLLTIFFRIHRAI